MVKIPQALGQYREHTHHIVHGVSTIIIVSTKLSVIGKSFRRLDMADHTCNVVELVGTSHEGVPQAIEGAIDRAGQTRSRI